MSTARFNTLENAAGSKSVPVNTLVDGSAKAWVNFNGTGTVAMRAAFNVSSITDNSTGDYTVNFTTAMPDANYAVGGFGGQNLDGGYIQLSTSAAPTTSACRITTGSIPGVHSARDMAYVCVAVFR